jgi:cbb3-type cytochrome oxidase subunit 3
MLNPLKAIFNIFLIVFFLIFICGTNVIYRQ